MESFANSIVILAGIYDSVTVRRIGSAIDARGLLVEPISDTGAILLRLQRSKGEIAGVIVDFGEAGACIDALRDMRAVSRNLPILVMSDQFSTSCVVAAMKVGASDFLPKPLDLCSLSEALDEAFGVSPRRRNVEVGDCGVRPFFAGSNRQMNEISALAGQIGRSNVPVLIQGETGSGKEVVARAIHNQSWRASKIFLKLNCAALPAELVESELFGYERGAFTGALRRKAGMFELADGGTLLLDEIGDMDVRLQAKLLQVVQDQEFRRVGGTEPVRVDVRLMSATHRDLRGAIRTGSFREDLYYRLNVVNIQVPPLRERREDIVAIAEFLIGRHALRNNLPIRKISAELKQAMLAYDWPGNVRELENCIQRLLVFEDDSVIISEIRTENLSQRPITLHAVESREFSIGEKTTDSVFEQATREKERSEASAILAILSKTRWNRKRAAQVLNVDYKSLLYKMKKLGIEQGKDVYLRRAANGTN